MKISYSWPQTKLDVDTYYDEQKNDEQMRVSLDLIKEKRVTVEDKEGDYKRKADKYFNKKVKSKQF